jgi:bifunctional DNase/RNase
LTSAFSDRLLESSPSRRLLKTVQMQGGAPLRNADCGMRNGRDETSQPLRCRRGGGGLALGLLLCAASPGAAQAPAPPAAPALQTYTMEVMGLAEDPGSGQPVVILRAKEDRRELLMFIDASTALGIRIAIEGQQLPRPYTHDLMLAALRALNATLVKVVITDLRDNAYVAALHLRAQGRDIELDSRPSDAVALALRANAPIFAAERVFRGPAQAPAPGEGR